MYSPRVDSEKARCTFMNKDSRKCQIHGRSKTSDVYMERFQNNKTTKKLIFKYTCQKMFDLKNNNV